MNKKTITLIKRIAERYGTTAQIGQTYEELGELITALHKYQRDHDKIGEVTEEMADVLIMIEQIRYLLGIKTADVLAEIDRKVDRQIERINEDMARWQE